MNKKLFAFLVFGLFTVMAFGASIDSISASLSTEDSSQEARAGDTITVTYSFTPTEFNAEGLILGASLGLASLNKIRIYWYTNNDGTGSSTTQDATTSTFIDQSVTNGVVNTKSLTFVLPEPPVGLTVSRYALKSTVMTACSTRYLVQLCTQAEIMDT